MIKNLIQTKKAYNASAESFKKTLLELKQQYPNYLRNVSDDSEIIDVNSCPSKIPHIQFYEILLHSEILGVKSVKIPSNINYLKTLEYEINRNHILGLINIIKSQKEKGLDYSKTYIDAVNEIKNLKKGFLNMYRKETNTFKEEIIFLYTIREQNGKDIQG